MTAITVPLSEDRLERLKALAERVGVSPEELARAGLEEWLARPREDFSRAAEYVLRKNAELYRRLVWTRVDLVKVFVDYFSPGRSDRNWSAGLAIR